MTAIGPSLAGHPRFTRRGFLAGAGAATAAGVLAPLLRPELALATGPGHPLLVVVVLDGGLDGLSALVPAGDGGYGRLRWSTRLGEGQVIPVDGGFGLHPALAPLAELWQSGLVAAVPATGTVTGSRSHFEEMTVLASGSGGGGHDGSGWIARHLLSRDGATSAMRAVSAGDLPSLELAHDAGGFYVPDLQSVGVSTFRDHPEVGTAMAAAYGGIGSPLSDAASAAFSAIGAIERSGAANQPSAPYPDDAWGAQLREVSQLVRAGVNLDAAVVRFSGFDTHAVQGGAAGQLAGLLDRFARAVHAFCTDLGDRLDQTTIVAVSEFGRRARENGSGGTDHGRGGVAFVVGRGIRGGVHGSWPGLADDQLDDGDLRVTTDLRSVFAEVVDRRLGNPNIGDVFPGWSGAYPGVIA